MRQQNGINAVQVADQLPEAGLSVRAAVQQHREAVDGEEGTVASAGRKDVAAGTGQLEETNSDGRRQEVEGGRRAKGAGDEGGEVPQGLHGRQHLWGIDVERERTLLRLVPQESVPPLADVGTAERQAELRGGGGRALFIEKLNTHRETTANCHFLSTLPG